MIARDVEAVLTGFSRLRAGAGVIVRGVENRTALAALELSEARREAGLAAASFALGVIALLLAGVAATLLVAAVYWETPHRVAALAWLAGIELSISVASFLWLRSRWIAFVPFSATREQLRKDSECLHEILPLQGR